MNKKGLFILEPPHLLDSAYAELLYTEATNQRSDGNKSILSFLRQSLKLGNAQSGWILINFSRPADLGLAKEDEKGDYFSYLIACVVLSNEAAIQELERVISKSLRRDLEFIATIFLKYCELGFEVQSWLQSIHKRSGSTLSTGAPLHAVIDCCKASDAGTMRE